MKIDFIVVTILLLFVSVFIFVVKPYGLGVSPDSVYYLEAAKSFSEGKGIIDKHNELVNHWPPMFPMTLGAFSLITGMDLLDAGIYYNALLIVALGLIWVSILKQLKIDRVLTYFLLIILLFSLPITVNRFFWSESLFLVLSSATIFLFLKWIEFGDLKFIVIAGIISGLFFMTRFAGAGFIAGFSAFIFFSRGTIYEKIKNTTIYLIPVLFCFLVWHFYTASFGQESLDRKFLFLWISIEKIKTGLMTIYSWFITYSYVSLPLLAAIFIFYFLELKKSYAHFTQYLKNYKKPTILMFLLIFSYLSFFAFVMFFFESRTTLDYRRLAPIFPIILLIFGLFINYFIKAKQTYKITYILLILLVSNMSKTSYDVWNSHYESGVAFTTKKRKNSEILKEISQNKNITLYTNNTFMLRFYSDLKPEFLPRKISTRAWIPTSVKRYKKEMENMKEIVKRGEAEIVYFKRPVNERLVLKPEILEEFKDYHITYHKDGFIIRKPI